MPLFAPGARLRDATVPFFPAAPTWPIHLSTVVETLTRIADRARPNVSPVSIPGPAGAHLDATWHAIDDGRNLLVPLLDHRRRSCRVVGAPDDVPFVEPEHRAATETPANSDRRLPRLGIVRDRAAGVGEPLLPCRENDAGVSQAGARRLAERGVRRPAFADLLASLLSPANRDPQPLLPNSVAPVVDMPEASAS